MPRCKVAWILTGDDQYQRAMMKTKKPSGGHNLHRNFTEGLRSQHRHIGARQRTRMERICMPSTQAHVQRHVSRTRHCDRSHFNVIIESQSGIAQGAPAGFIKIGPGTASHVRPALENMSHDKPLAPGTRPESALWDEAT